LKGLISKCWKTMKYFSSILEFCIMVTFCYSLDVEYPSNMHVSKVWSAGWCCWEVVEPLGGASERLGEARVKCVCGCPWSQLWDLNPSSFFFCFLACDISSWLCHVLLPWCVALSRAEVAGPLNIGLGPLESLNNNNNKKKTFFLYRLISVGISLYSWNVD
jgi:hypothetical protein